MTYIFRSILVVCALSFYLFGAAQSFSPSQKLSSNKTLALRFCNEVVNERHLDLVDSIVARDYKEHQADRHYLNTRYGLKRGLHNFLEAFPDMHIKVNFVTEEGNIVTAQYTMTGTHVGRMYQHKATNRKINVEGVDIVRIENGKIVEHWGYVEEARLLRQLRTRLPQLDEKDILKIDTAKRKETTRDEKE